MGWVVSTSEAALQQAIVPTTSAAMVDPKRPPKYHAAPIVEAVVELRFASPSTDARAKKAADWLRSRYRSEEIEQLNQAQIDFMAQKVTFTDDGKVHKLSSEDLTHLCHISGKSVAWVERAPYEGWEVFAGRFSEEAPIALKAINDKPISRIGLRYVNRIDVQPQGGLSHYEEYLNFKIDAGPLLEPTNGYLWQLTKRFEDLELSANVQSAVVEPEIPGMHAFTFDIDVFCDSNVPQQPDVVMAKLEEMRDLKNRIFEAGITDKAREQYS
jgi:uncharacterized protein (TIGR04255 family)